MSSSRRKAKIKRRRRAHQIPRTMTISQMMMTPTRSQRRPRLLPSLLRTTLLPRATRLPRKARSQLQRRRQHQPRMTLPPLMTRRTTKIPVTMMMLQMSQREARRTRKLLILVQIQVHLLALTPAMTMMKKKRKRKSQRRAGRTVRSRTPRRSQPNKDWTQATPTSANLSSSYKVWATIQPSRA